MQLVVAIIKPFKIGDVRQALEDNGVNGITILEVKGFGRQKGHTELYRGAEYHVDYMAKVLVATLVPDDRVPRIKQDICDAARTGKVGDGIVFSLPAEDYIRIRTLELITNEKY